MGSTSQQFCLKWNNHSSNMLNVFETLLTSEQLVDVTLACDGLSLKAHKMVLSACSPFFQSLFQENPCKHPIVILKDIRYTDLKAIIDFMYKGEVNVGQAHLSALLKTAETLKVKGLAEVSGEDGQSSSGSVVQQEVPVFPQAQHSSDVANIVQTIDSSIRPSSDSPTGRKRKRTKWKNRAGQSGGNDSETDDQGPAAKNQEIVSAEVIEDDSSSIGVVEPSDTRNAKESRIIIEEATIVGDYVEPAALMEQNMTTDNVQPVSSQLMLTNATSKDNNINVPESRSYDTTVATMNPETVDLIDRPEDVKPTALVSYEEPPMSPNATSSHHSQDDSNSMTMYMDPNSMPAIAGPSNYQQDKQPSASAGQDNLDAISCYVIEEDVGANVTLDNPLIDVPGVLPPIEEILPDNIICTRDVSVDDSLLMKPPDKIPDIPKKRKKVPSQKKQYVENQTQTVESSVLTWDPKSFRCTRSIRGKANVFFEGNKYTIERQNADGDFSYYKCVEYIRTKCRARIHISRKRGEVVKYLDLHNHEPTCL